VQIQIAAGAAAGPVTAMVTTGSAKPNSAVAGEHGRRRDVYERSGSDRDDAKLHDGNNPER
jgi:hypothetical protein